MWRLKSPIDEKKSIDLENFVQEAGNINIVKNIYERLIYMSNKDIALLLIAKELGINYTEEIFTLEKSRIVYINEIYSYKKIILFFLQFADKVDYIIPDVSEENGITKYSEEFLDWEYYIPDIFINDFYKNNLYKFKNINDKDKMKECYLKFAKKVYEEQKRLAKELFFTIDEKDKEGFIDVCNYFYSLFNYKENNLYSLLKENKVYEKVLNIYPLFDDDIDILLDNSEFNNNEPYITIKNEDLTCEWNYSIGAFVNYFSFITEKGKNTNWLILKKLFPQFINTDLRKWTKHDNQDFFDLMARVPSFKSKLKKDEIPDDFEKDKEEICKRITNLNKEYSHLKFIKDK
jgi:hypothetical protein